MKKIVFVLFLICAISIKAQNDNLNSYKYVIVSEKFDFLKTPDQYQTSSLTKFLLKKSGFEVFLSNGKLPSDYLKERCLALFANVVDKSSMFSTKSYIELKDCYGNLLYKSKLGASKLKEYKKSYHESIRNAYESMEDITYSYQPKKDNTGKKNKIVVKEKVVLPIVNTDKITTISKDTITIKKDFEKKVVKLKVLYAQEKENGYQLVNTKPEVVFMLFKTNVKDVFIVKNRNGILYKNNENWVLEYYKNEILITEKYQIKF